MIYKYVKDYIPGNSKLSKFYLMECRDVVFMLSDVIGMIGGMDIAYGDKVGDGYTHLFRIKNIKLAQ